MFVTSARKQAEIHVDAPAQSHKVTGAPLAFQGVLRWASEQSCGYPRLHWLPPKTRLCSRACGCYIGTSS